MKEFQALGLDISIIDDNNQTLELKEIEEEEYKDDFNGTIEEAQLTIPVSEPDEEYIESEKEDEDIEEEFEEIFEGNFEEGDEN